MVTFNDNANKALSILNKYEEWPIPIRMEINRNAWFVSQLGSRIEIIDYNENLVNDDAGNNRRRLHLISLLEQRCITYTSEEKSKMNALLEHQFINRVRESVTTFIVDHDYDRYTENEIETVIRLFPEILSEHKLHIDGDGLYPIQSFIFFSYSHLDTWWCILRLVPFIPLYARLGIEFGQFTKEQRGGLLIENREGDNTLHFLVKSCPSVRNFGHRIFDNPINHEPVDNTFLQVLVKLRLMGLLTKDDINDYNLVSMLCEETVFGEKRFRFLVEWDPTSLITPDANGYVPIQYIARYSSSIHGFEIVFDYCIRYYPTKEGIRLLFIKDDDGDTPFQMACDEYGTEEVRKVIENTLARYSDNTPINIEETFLLAAIDENIHLDGLNYLLRRQPHVLETLLLHSSSSSTTTTTTKSAELTKKRYNLRKRKRIKWKNE